MSSIISSSDGYRANKHAMGRIMLFSYDPVAKKVTRIIERRNLILYTGADLLAKCLSGDEDAKINTIYFEYKNLATPTDTVTPPSYDRSDPSTYYAALSGSSDTDIIRASLASTPVFDVTSTDYSNNVVTFIAMTETATGYYGKTFLYAANSNVYGAALVAAPNPNDITTDVVFARTYFNQVPKQPNQQIGIKWTITFV